MMEIVRFMPAHLKELRLQMAQRNLADTILKAEYANALALSGPCFTVVVDGQPVCCAGAQEFHPHRAEVWALMSRDARPVMRQMTRAARGWFEQCLYARLEMHVATDFEAGHRWARMLGFVVEGPEKLAYSRDGGSVIPYVRLK
jgi:hypothetical protein